MAASPPEVIHRALSQRAISSVTPELIDNGSLIPAAVLVVLYAKDDDYCVLLNKRSEEVEHHKGEISFPGGAWEPKDESLMATALRETHEEMGVLPEDVDVLGELDDTPTSSRFLISPYVGAIPEQYRFKPSELEVAEILEVPVLTLLDDECVRDEVRIAGGRLINSPAYSFQGHLIFGATARILNRFLELLETDPQKEAVWRIMNPQP